MDILLVIAALVLTVVLWCLYHKIFKVYYFGNPIKAMAGELGAALMTSIVIMAIVGELLKKIFSGILFILPYVLGLIVILVIIQFVRKQKGNNTTTSAESDGE